LEEQKIDLEARLKKIEQHKEEVLLESNVLKISIDDLFSQTASKRIQARQNITAMGTKMGIHQSDMYKYLGPDGRVKFEKVLRKAAIDKKTIRSLASDLASNHLTVLECEAIIAQYKYFNKTGNFGNFCDDARKNIIADLKDITGNENIANTAYQNMHANLDIFEDLLKIYIENKKTINSLETQTTTVLKEKSKLERQLTNSKQEALEYDALMPIYSDFNKYKIAQNQAETLRAALEKNGTEKLTKTKGELNTLTTELAALQKNTTPFSGQVYSILQEYSKSNNSEELLNAKKEILANYKNGDPGKELGLFRTKILDVYGTNRVDRKDVPAVLAEFRRFDDIMIMRLQKMRDLEAKIGKLQESYNCLSSKYG
jgi:DNA-binding phage protein